MKNKSKLVFLLMLVGLLLLGCQKKRHHLPGDGTGEKEIVVIIKDMG